jgi:hypothetical protein
MNYTDLSTAHLENIRQHRLLFITSYASDHTLQCRRNVLFAYPPHKPTHFSKEQQYNFHMQAFRRAGDLCTYSHTPQPSNIVYVCWQGLSSRTSYQGSAGLAHKILYFIIKRQNGRGGRCNRRMTYPKFAEFKFNCWRNTRQFLSWVCTESGTYYTERQKTDL